MAEFWRLNFIRQFCLMGWDGIGLGLPQVQTSVVPLVIDPIPALNWYLQFIGPYAIWVKHQLADVTVVSPLWHNLHKYNSDARVTLRWGDGDIGQLMFDHYLIHHYLSIGSEMLTFDLSTFASLSPPIWLNHDNISNMYIMVYYIKFIKIGSILRHFAADRKILFPKSINDPLFWFIGLCMVITITMILYLGQATFLF